MGLFDFVADVAIDLATVAVTDAIKEKKQNSQAKTQNITLSPKAALYLALIQFANTQNKVNKIASIVGQDNLQGADFQYASAVSDTIEKSSNPTLNYINKVIEDTDWKKEYRYNILLNIIDVVTYENMPNDYQILDAYIEAFGYDIDSLETIIQIFKLKNQSDLPQEVIMYTQLLMVYNSTPKRELYESYFNLLYKNNETFDQIFTLFAQQVKKSQDFMYPLGTITEPISDNFKLAEAHYPILSNMLDMAYLGGKLHNGANAMLEEVLESMMSYSTAESLDTDVINMIDEIMKDKNTHDYN